MSSALSARWLLVALVVGGACHHAPPPDAAPVVAARPNTNLDAQDRARRDAARRDSMARADAARADADQRARDAAAARATIGEPVYFDFDKAELLPPAIAALNAKVPVLHSHSRVRIHIEGNADDRGSNEYNMALGQRRAASAKRYLVANGIDVSRIETVSYGEERPVCRAETESCWHQNRRDEFVISAGTDVDVTGRP